MNGSTRRLTVFVGMALMSLAVGFPADAFTYRVGSEAALQRALGRAGPGDIIEVNDGRYRVTVTFARSGTAEQPIVMRARHTGRAIIDASDRDAGILHGGKAHIEIEGMVIENAANGPQAAQAMVRSGSYWTLRHCTIRNATGAGLGIEDVERVRVFDCLIQHHGQIGAAVSGSRDVLIQDTVIAHNNRGFDTQEQIDAARITEKIEHAGRWYTNPAWEGGGIKVSSSTGVTLKQVTAHDNHGPALWVDYACSDITITGCNASHNRSLNEGWQGMGVMVEYNAHGPITVEGNRVEANEGVGLGIAESRNVRVTRNHLIDDELEFRDMDRPESSLGPVRVDHNLFERSRVQTSLGEWDRHSGRTKQLTIDHNRWLDGVRYEWGGSTYRDLAAVQEALGFERAGSTITVPTPPLDESR